MSDSVLFLSTSNSRRGQMAEALLRRHAPGRFEVHSARLHPAEIHRLTHHVMNDLGMNLSGHRPKGVREFFRLSSSPRLAIIFCETTEPDCPKLYPGALQILRWRFEDPARAADGDTLTEGLRFSSSSASRFCRCFTPPGTPRGVAAGPGPRGFGELHAFDRRDQVSHSVHSESALGPGDSWCVSALTCA